jgi:hypothetical protein
MQFQSRQSIVIPKHLFSREESAVSLPAASRFLADKPGVGMTSGGVREGNQEQARHREHSTSGGN